MAAAGSYRSVLANRPLVTMASGHFAVDMYSGNSYQREHVTPYYREHLHGVGTSWRFASGALRRPELRWCVDEQADLDFVREVYRRGWDALSTAELIKALDGAPELRDMNKGVRQKGAKG